MKPGYKTTEFWAAAGSLIIAALVQLGAVDVSSEKHLATVAGSALTAVYLVGQYIAGRHALKAGGRDPEPLVGGLVQLLARHLERSEPTAEQLQQTTAELLHEVAQHRKGAQP